MFTNNEKRNNYLNKQSNYGPVIGTTMYRKHYYLLSCLLSLSLYYKRQKKCLERCLSCFLVTEDEVKLDVLKYRQLL